MISSQHYIYLIYFSSFLYFTKLVPISPVYFLVPITLMTGINKSTVNIYHIIFVAVILSLMTAWGLPYQYLINTFVGASAMLVVLNYNLKPFFSTNVLKTSNGILIFILLIEAIVRYHRVLNEGYTTHFEMKYDSFLFSDSNTTAYAVFCVFIVELILINRSIRRSKIPLFFLIALLLLTLSKTMILLSAILYICHFKFRYLIPLVLIIAVSTYKHISIILLDPSMIVRLSSLSKFYDFILSASTSELLFGSGWYNFRYVLYADEPHSLVFTVIGAGGFLGMMIAIFSSHLRIL